MSPWGSVSALILGDHGCPCTSRVQAHRDLRQMQRDARWGNSSTWGERGDGRSFGANTAMQPRQRRHDALDLRTGGGQPIQWFP